MFSLYESDLYDNGKVLWRYMNFNKFFSLITNSALFFPSALCLNKMDSYEGIIPKVKQDFSVEFEKNDFIDCLYINSWYMSKYESRAMWKIYADDEGGIAIKTTIERLKGAFNLTLEPKLNSVKPTKGKVIYIKYRNDFMPYSDSEQALKIDQMSFFIFKPVEFEHEKEFRLIINDYDRVFYNENSSVHLSGINIKIDLDTLIDKVVLAPNTPNWVEQNINVLLSTNGIKKDTIKSGTHLRMFNPSK